MGMGITAILLTFGASAVCIEAPTPPGDFAAKALLAQDVDSGEILYEKNAEEPRAIASITKLLAALMLHEQGLDLDGRTTMLRSDYEFTAGGARSRLMTNHDYLNRDLLHGALLGSDNRAIVAMGRSVGLEMLAMTLGMNRLAWRLGVQGAFADPTGIDHGNHASAYDVVKLLKAVLDQPALAEIARTDQWTTSSNERRGIPLAYRSTNLLVHDENREVLVGKTGFNSAAGWCVASVLKIHERRVAIVVLGSPTKYVRFRDARKLHDWVARTTQ